MGSTSSVIARMTAFWKAFLHVEFPVLAVNCRMQSIPGVDPYQPVASDR
jgi:hypothetical protein